MQYEAELQKTIEDMVQPGKGILAADESLPTIEKRFRPIGVESTPETRRAWRSLLLTTPGLGEYISGVILFEETLTQTDDTGTPLPQVAEKQGIVPGIKVDKGKIPLVNAPGDLITQGLDFLAERLETYRQQGARFAKWREVYPISPENPRRLGITANAEVLARYAAICQSAGLVPIVEPEVLIDGDITPCIAGAWCSNTPSSSPTWSRPARKPARHHPRKWPNGRCVNCAARCRRPCLLSISSPAARPRRKPRPISTP